MHNPAPARVGRSMAFLAEIPAGNVGGISFGWQFGQVVGRLGRTRLRGSWRAWRVAHNTQMREREQTEVQVITGYASSASPALIPTAQPSANVREVTQAIVDEGDAHRRAVIKFNA